MEVDHLNCRFPLVFSATVHFPRIKNDVGFEPNYTRVFRNSALPTAASYKKFSKIPEIFKTPLVTF